MAAAETASTPLVGRGEELRALAQLIGVGSGAHGAVLLGGDAGAGKSRLVRELSVRAAGERWRVLVGHCLDFGDSSPPYLPFSEALGRLDATDPAAAEALVAGFPAVAGLLPAHRLMSVAEADGEPTAPASLFDAVHGALTRLAETGPVLLIVEDVHWADQSTRDLMRFLFAREFDAPVAVLATYRSDDLHRRHPLRAALAEWTRLPAVSRVQLGPLDDRAAGQLVHALHPAPLPDSEVRHILARAEGNPFFIEELVAASEATGGLLPADLSDLLLVRLEQLGDEGRRVVRAASVAGRRVSHPLLAHGADLADGALDGALRAAVEANILVALESDGYAFRHALLAEAIYQDLLPGERVRLHARYAEALANHRAEGSAAELSRHARASHDLLTATRASIEAGDEAMAVGGPEEAVRHYELALELLADNGVAAALAADPDAALPVDHVGLVIRASNAAAAAGHQFRAVALAQEELAQLGDTGAPRDRARLINALATTALGIDSQLDVLGLTNEAVRLLADEPFDALRARVLSVHARAHADRARDDDAARWAGEALQIARDLRLPAVATDATLLLARIEERAGDPLSAERSILAAISEARTAGEPLAELRGMYQLASVHYTWGQVQEAVKVFCEAAKRAEALGRKWGPYGLDSVAFGAIAALAAGEWDLAAELVAGDGQPLPELAEALLGAIGLEIAAGRGNLGALERLPKLQSWWSLDGLVAISSAAGAIELYGQSGDIAAARAVHDAAVEHVSRMWQRPGFLARVRLAALLVGQLATAAAAATGPDRAELVAATDELGTGMTELTDAGRTTGPELAAWAQRLTAEAARVHWLAGIDSPGEPELVELWRATVAGFERFGHVYETARSRARLAAVLCAAGAGDAGHAEAAAAMTVAGRLDARPLRRELQGLSPHPPVAGRERDAESLTPRERDVLELVATGRSNREIAGQLFISAKTVSVHISNVLAKLGAASRTEAVAIARRRGLLT